MRHKERNLYIAIILLVVQILFKVNIMIAIIIACIVGMLSEVIDYIYEGLIKNNIKDNYKENGLENINYITFEYELKKDQFKIYSSNSNLEFLQKIKSKKDIKKCIHNSDYENIYLIVKDALLNKKEQFVVEYRVFNDDKEICFFAKGNINYIDNKIIISGSSVDVTEIKIKKIEDKSLDYINQKDNITGLYNRHYLKEYIDKYIETNESNNKSAALILIDLDKFKYVNDFWGHDYGDLFLRKVAEGFSKIISEKDLLCRFGGDEFIIFIPDVEDINNVRNLVDSIIEFFKNPKSVNDKSIYTSASIGISIFPNDAVNFKNLLKNADAAMYAAKSNGRSTYQFYNSKISNELTRIYEIEKGLRSSLEKNEIYVEFQPKVILEDNRIQGFEALMRWKSEELGFVSPGEFIPVAENTRMILPISTFLLEEVFKRSRELIDIGHKEFKIAINLSEIQLREGSIVDEFKELMEKYQVDFKYIEVEITEGMLMKSFEHNIKILNNLKELGISIALDDFGTGYSSLNYLTKLPIDVLKIDRTFLLDILSNEKSRYIVENIIQLSHKLGISVIAEGVEVKEQVDYLKGILCDGVQGYYFSKPIAFNNAKLLIQEKYIF